MWTLLVAVVAACTLWLSVARYRLLAAKLARSESDLAACWSRECSAKYAYSLLETELVGTRKSLMSLASTVSGCDSHCEVCKDQAQDVRKQYLGDPDWRGPWDSDSSPNGTGEQYDAHVHAWIDEHTGKCDRCATRPAFRFGDGPYRCDWCTWDAMGSPGV